MVASRKCRIGVIFFRQKQPFVRYMPTLEETTTYFEQHAERLRAERLVDKSSALRELLFDRLAPGSRVLEVGAGTGLYTLALLEDGHQVLAVDLSPACLGQIEARVAGSARARQLSVRAGDFLDVARELGQEAFDAVTFIKVLHHFPDRAAIRNALQRGYDLLTPGGKLLIFEPNGSHPLWPPFLLSRGFAHWKNEKNVLLVRRSFLDEVAAELPGATSSCRYRFVIPGGLIKRFPRLARIDRRICRRDRPWLDYLAINVAFEITKGARDD